MAIKFIRLRYVGLEEEEAMSRSIKRRKPLSAQTNTF